MNSLEIDGVKLREIIDSDAAVLMELNNDPQTAKYVIGEPKPVTLEEQLKWMQKIKTEQSTVRFMVEFESAPVGTIIISEIKRDARTGSVGIKLLNAYRGRGIGKKAIRAALEYCFNALDMVCVTAQILTDNNASVTLYERSGFKKEGVLRSRVVKFGTNRDLASYSILRSEYEQLKSTTGE